MSEETVYMVPNPPTAAARPLKIDPDLCNGCNICVETCQADILMPNPEKGKSPIILYPDECWHCGCCTFHCPQEGALKLNYSLQWRVPWKDKVTGEYYWVGMKNPPPPNLKPAV